MNDEFESDFSKRRTFLRTTGFATVAAVGAGCLGDNGDDDDTGAPDDDETVAPDDGEYPDLTGTQLHVLAESSSRPYQDYWQNLAADFQEATGARVNVEFAGFADGFRNRTIQLLQAGDPPDVGHISLNMAPAVADYLIDHTEVVEHWEETWGDSYRDDFRYKVDGEDRFLPLHTNIPTNWYRSDIFDEPPDTFESELAQAAEHDDPDGVRGAHIAPATIGEDLSVWTRFWSMGGELIIYDEDADEYVNGLNEQENVDVLTEIFEHYQELYEYSDPNEDASLSVHLSSLASERSAQAWWNGSAPKTIAADEPFAIDIAPAKTPVPEGEPYVTWANIQGKGVYEGTGNEEAALELLKFMAEPENAMGWYFAEELTNDPLLPAMTDHELWADNLQNLPDYWDLPRDARWDWVHEDADWVQDHSTETNPPNPYGVQYLLENGPQRMLFDILVEGEDIETAIANQAERYDAILGDRLL